MQIGRAPLYPNTDAKNRYQGVDVESDGTLDTLQYCKCESTPHCNLRTDYANACGSNQYLCCYDKAKKPTIQANREFFNEVNDGRPFLQQEQGNAVGTFQAPNFVGHPDRGTGTDTRLFIGPNKETNSRPILIGPQGPTGIIGPADNNNKSPAFLVGTSPGNLHSEDFQGVLVGPSGPTGIVGPSFDRIPSTSDDRGVLTGPDGPTGILGPSYSRPVLVGPGVHKGDLGPSETAQRGVLVGPGGPTGFIGPSRNRAILVGPGGPTGIIGPAQNRPVLVGPGGPTGIIGPAQNRPVLVGPGGPTGIIGPNRPRVFINRPSSNRGILIGPGGPTGIIGPGRQVLVGPGGPTGQIGPRNYECSRRIRNRNKMKSKIYMNFHNHTSCACHKH
ncbi:collagen alpha-2(I) chain-like isoform X2 [Leptidea sinapis]|nr:collagen alpha-2(I) chain-like isoform X2 [Leptidea sinapis]